jgi:hypothetical protein
MSKLEKRKKQNAKWGDHKKKKKKKKIHTKKKTHKITLNFTILSRGCEYQLLGIRGSNPFAAAYFSKNLHLFSILYPTNVILEFTIKKISIKIAGKTINQLFPKNKHIGSITLEQ